MLKRKSFFDKIYQICCEESIQISYWGWETVNYLGFAAKSWLVGAGVWKEPQRHRGHKDWSLLYRACWKSFSWGQGVGCRVWGVGFYPFSGGQLPNFQGKSPGIFPALTPIPGTFGFQKSLKIWSNKVFRFIQPVLPFICQIDWICLGFARSIKGPVSLTKK